MNYTTINALFRYFEALHNLNQKLFALCGTDVFNHMGEQENLIDEIIITIPRLIPYAKIKNTDKIELVKEDGLMKFSDDISFLKADYESMIQNHNVFLKKVKKIRNKLEHEIDNARIMGSGSSPSSQFSFVYKIDKNDFGLCSEDVISLIKDLNVLFSKIQGLVNQFTCNNSANHPFVRRLTNYNFSDFNKIYESDLLTVFGKIMLPF